jgi:hypothetical protein
MMATVGENRVLSQGRLFFRSALTDASGYFRFSGLPEDSSFIIRPHLETYTFEPTERSIATGQVTTLFNVEPSDLNAPTCSRRNTASIITSADAKALALQAYILRTINTSAARIRKEVRDVQSRAKAEKSLAKARANVEFVYYEVMNESFAIPKVTLTCTKVPSQCAKQSYESTVTKYRRHLRTLLQLGLRANRSAGGVLGKPGSSLASIAQKIGRLHRYALQATQRMPTKSVECP